MSDDDENNKGERRCGVSKRNPIRVFWSDLSQRFYATRSYRIRDGIVTVTGEKFDVTQDIAAAVVEHKIEFSKKEEKQVQHG